MSKIPFGSAGRWSIQTGDLSHANDIVIPVMGPTGVGKSTFISNILKYLGSSQEVECSDGFTSCTSDLKVYSVTLDDAICEFYSLPKRQKLVLVDTPGFDSTYATDTEVLRRIATWLASAYHANMKVGGVVYIYPIYPGKITRSDCANVRIFRKICGDGELNNVTLATTRWDLCPEATGEAREKEISENFWGDKGTSIHRPTMARLLNTEDSAWAVVKGILETLERSGVVLALQRQLVDKGQILQQTDAARELRAKILSLLEESASDPRNPKRRERLEALAREAKELKIPLSKRLQTFFSVCGN